MFLDFLRNTWKAHASALGTIGLFILGRATGFVEPPPVETLTPALNEVVTALVVGGISWLVTYFFPANKPA